MYPSTKNEMGRVLHCPPSKSVQDLPIFLWDILAFREVVPEH